MSGTFENGRSKIAGGVTEVALMTPIIPGRIPGERRTYEERLRDLLGSTQSRAERGLPTAVLQVSSIHFARWVIIRPENYLLHSSLSDVDYHEHKGTPGRPSQSIVDQIDEYTETVNSTKAEGHVPASGNGLRSWLLTLILFDGDVQVYGREIATFVRGDVDRIFENCEDYPYAENFPEWWVWFRRHQLNAEVFYNAYPGLSVARIKELERFKAKFDAFVAQVRPHGAGFKTSSHDATNALLDEFIRDTQALASGFPSAGGVFKDQD